jgi:transposase-like protein
MVTIAFKGSHFERDVILWGVRWYVAYPLSYRQIEEMMEERGVICAGFGEGTQASRGRQLATG